jgi:hypothetical protein
MSAPFGQTTVPELWRNSVRCPCQDRRMAKAGRNEPCPCGSGRKTKRCCDVTRGPVDDELERAFLAGEALTAALSLSSFTDKDLDRLWDEMLELPARHLTLQFPVPTLMTSQLQQLLERIHDGEIDGADDALDDALEQLDTPAARGLLARAVIALRDAGRLGRELAAVAILDLGTRSQALLGASLIEAAAVATGVAPTPGGLIVAHRLAA